MTTQEKVQHITEKVYQANPKKPKIRAYCMVRGHEKNIEEPIALADILLAIPNKQTYVYADGLFYIEPHQATGIQWNLSNDSLSYHAEHNQEVIDFIYSILS